MAAELHISINAEKIFDVAGVSISNSILTTWLVSILIFFLAHQTYKVFTRAKFSQKPGRFQSLMEMIIESLFNLVNSIAGSQKKARAFFPIIATLFIFILISNWSGLIPGVGTIGFREEEPVHAQETVAEEAGTMLEEVEESHDQEKTQESKSDSSQIEGKEAVLDEHGEVAVVNDDSHQTENEEVVTEHEAEEVHSAFVPYFRGPTADLNTTLALAIFAMVGVQIAGFKYLGFHYPSKFFTLKNPMDFFVGLLELVSEFSKVISFAFRLFGNIFAGEVLLAVIAFLMPLFGPLPFLGLEIFVGFIQALVFSMLTLVFMNLATMGHGQESH